MEPRSHERGNGEEARRQNLERDASMEPRSHERGNEVVEGVEFLLCVASMEPRSHERGNPVMCRAGRPLGFRASMEPRSHDERGNQEPRSHERKRRNVIVPGLANGAAFSERGNSKAES